MDIHFCQTEHLETPLQKDVMLPEFTKVVLVSLDPITNL